MNSGDTQIAGWKTADDWRTLRNTLVIGGDSALWQKAFDEYFQERLRLRYLGPIRLLQQHGTFQGEGFSILAIQCSLIEFLESTVQGLTYRYLRKGQTLGMHEYNKSGALFAHFLCKRPPFDTQFTAPLAKDFYENVRCGLLHEARTKNGWRVWAFGAAGKIVDATQRIVYRDNFQTALDAFIAWYGAALLTETNLQEAFIRKFEDLCN